MKLVSTAQLLCLSLLLLHALHVEGQDGEKLPNILSLAIRGHYGFIIPHSRAIAEISSSNPWGMEADLSWHLMRERIWNHCFCYPRTGFSLNYYNFSFPEVLGHSVALYPYIEPYIRPQKPFSVSFRFGIGPAWVSKIYDAETNPDNFFFSSRLSFMVVLNAAVNYRLNSRLTTRAAFNFNHISNGGIRQPNVGMNFPTVNAGFDYSFRDVSFPCRLKDTVKLQYARKSWWDAYVLGTMKNVEKGENLNYAVIGAGMYYNYRTGRNLALTAGMEWISDFSEKEKIRREYLSDPGSAPDHNRAAVLLGFDLLFGRITFVYQWGIYYYAPYRARSWGYQRYGLNLKFKERFYVGINIKAHTHVADLMDARLGIVF